VVAVLVSLHVLLLLLLLHATSSAARAASSSASASDSATAPLRTPSSAAMPPPEECDAAAAPPGVARAQAQSSAATDAEERYEGLDNPSIVVSAETPLLRVPVLSLRPTQLAVGRYSVGLKAEKVARKRARGGAEEALDDWLRRHPIPCVRGPPLGAGEAPPLYMIDHHHLAAALHSLGIEDCYAAAVRDYSALSDQDAFWAAMQRDGCLWPHDERGAPLAWEELPRLMPPSVVGLRDDPYRSLAGIVRRAGGYEKSATPYAEFVWANHFRTRVPLPARDEGEGGGGEAGAPVVVDDVSKCVDEALVHAYHPDAEGLPGFTPAEG
jgi:hypothetical protein